MKEPRETVPVFFTIDDGYAPLLGVALYSMLQNASKDYQYEVFVIYMELSKENREKLAALKTEQCNIHFIKMKEKLHSIQDRMGSRLRADYFTLTIYFRLFIPDMFPGFDKGIYLDSDIVVPGDISELYREELKDTLLGAVIDPVIAKVPELTKHARLCVGVDSHKYFNSGVLLMNLKELRKARLGERFLELHDKYHFDAIAPDQDYLNAMCKGRVTYLSAVWDAMPSEDEAKIVNPKLVHYNLFSKPWYYDGVQYEEYFWPYAEASGYLPEILNMKKGHTKQDKQADSEHMALLISRGNVTGDGEVTFRSVFNEGIEARL